MPRTRPHKPIPPAASPTEPTLGAGRRIALMSVLLIMIAACGFRGPLYLPEDAPAETRTEQAAGTEDEAKAEDDADDEDEHDQRR